VEPVPIMSHSPRQKVLMMQNSSSPASVPTSPQTPGGSVGRVSSAVAPNGTGVFLGGRFSQANISAFGGIPVGSAARCVRSS
jgi:hypothetical protein